MKRDRSCLLLEKKRDFRGCCVRLCAVVFFVVVLIDCSASKSARKDEASRQPDVQQSAERLKIRAEQAGALTQGQDNQKTEKRLVDKENSAINERREGVPAQTDEEKLSNMDNKVDESLREFDEMLLEKNREISRKQQILERAGGRSPDAEVEGGDVDSQRGKEEQSDNYVTGSGQESQEDRPITTPSAPGKGRSAATSQPKGIPGGSDDDVVARQLREAAEKETDPQLKKKLWEEYKRYKEG